MRRTIAFIFTAFLLLSSCRKQTVENLISDIVVIGSSTAAGLGASVKDSSWAGKLSLKNPEWKFSNLSIPGTTTYEFLPAVYLDSNNQKKRPIPNSKSNIDKVLERQPWLVIISITTNDIANGFGVDEYLRNIQIITGEVQKAGQSFIVTSPTLRGDLPAMQNRKLRQIARTLRTQYPDNFVDIMTPICDTTHLSIHSQFFSSDLVHPNNIGHDKIFQQINKKLEQYK